MTLHVAYDARTTARPSGVGLYTSELLQALAQEPGLRLTAVAAPGQPLPEGVERLETDVAFDRHGPAEWFEHLVLPKLLRARGVQVLHGPNWIVPRGAQPFARVATVHDVAFRRFPETLGTGFRTLMKARTAGALASCERVLAVSRFTADELRELYPTFAYKVVAIPSGTPEAARTHVRDPERARVLLAPLGLEPGRYVCAIGTLEPRKNLPALLEAFARAGLPGVRLALVGDRGWRDGPLREALSRMPAGSVVLTGWLDGGAVRDLLGESLGLAYPSLYEGFGFPPLEALALGVPAVCADLPPIRESCDGRARLVDPKDVDALAAALRELPAAERPGRWVARTFRVVAAETAELYREVARIRR